MGPHEVCGEHQDPAMERGRALVEGVQFNLFVSIAMCLLAHQWCGGQLGGEKSLEHVSAGPSQEGRVQPLGWLRAHLSVAAIYNWGR